MTTFYFQVEMTKPSGHYWTVGLKLEAESYTEALRIFKAWSYGIQAMGPLTPNLCSLSNRATPNRSYFNMDSAKAILEELTTFMNEFRTVHERHVDEGKELLDKLVESQQQNLDEDTP